MTLPQIVFVDVDDTLIRSCPEGSRATRMPIPRAIRYVRRLRAAGAALYCWSSGGADYARLSAEECGLADCFAGFLPKPDLILDDQPPADWRRTAWMHPLGCPDGE